MNTPRRLEQNLGKTQCGMEMMKAKTLASVTLCSAILFGASLYGQISEPAGESTSSAAQSTNNNDVAALKALLVEQQKQIDALKSAMEEQKKLIQRATTSTPTQPGQDTFALPRSKALGDVASTTPMIPPVAPAVAPAIAPVVDGGQKTTSTNPCEDVPNGPTPAFIRLGSTCLTPIGFMDLTSLWRDKNAASSIGTNFGSIPYNNTVNGKISEFRFSPQNSRIGFRFDGDWKGTHFIGYNEFDFLGTSAALNLTVTNGAFVPRLRLFWVDARKGSWEFLAGQSWSMLTPNRTGISALPGDLFYSQVIDVNYMAGLTWTRQPGMRVLFHAGDKVTFGFSAENPDQYIGGSGGEGAITLPAAYTGLAGTQLDNAPSQFTGPNTVLAVPTLTPDFIAKVAFDPSSRFHAEVTGLERNFKILNTANLSLGQTNTKAGGGIQVGLNGEIFPGFRLITTNYWSDGGGRYLFGESPDLVVNANAALSLVHAGGTVDGFEARIHKLLLYAYYGGIYIGRNSQVDATGKPVGYGYTGSPNNQNRAIQEISFGFNQTIWADPRYGAINLMGQYAWITRAPWYVAAGAPDATHDNTIFVNVRYTLPGGMPKF
jgi:hypothetical protein